MSKDTKAQEKSRPMGRLGFIVYNLVVVAIMVCAVEGVFYMMNRNTPEGPQPYLVDHAALRAGQPGIRQVGNTAKMSYLDPHLGYAHDPAVDDSLGDAPGTPGFAVYGDPSDPQALRIVALGGSTTDPLDPGNWPRALQRILAARGIPSVVFNGGVSGYSSNQELLKLIRDALPLRPDMVLSLSGINDLGFLHSIDAHPMVHPYQTAVLGKVGARKSSAILPNTMTVVARWREARTPEHSRVDGIHLGPEVETTPAAQWTRNIRLAHAVTSEMDAAYLAFLQPVLGVGKYTPSAEDDELLAEATGQKREYLANLEKFYASTRITADTLPYVTSLVDVFEGHTTLYRDARHPNREGYALIAEAVASELCARGLLERFDPECNAAPEPLETTAVPRESREGVEILRNGSFEEWIGGLPRGWVRTEGRVTPATAVTDGQQSIALAPPLSGAGSTRIQQTVSAETGLSGRTAFLQLDAKSATPAFGFGVYASIGGEQTLLTRGDDGEPGWINHPGGGTWAALSQEFTIPTPVEEGTLRLVLMNRAGAQSPALVDRVSLILLPE